MRRCPYCGRLNASGDFVCYNCENPLAWTPEEGNEAHLSGSLSRPRLEGCWDDGPSRGRSRSRIERIRRTPSLLQLFVYGLVRKALFLFLSIGLFFTMALLAIWLTYDNFFVALLVVGVFLIAVLFALYYPDIRLSRRHGSKMIVASFLSNLTILAIITPLILLYLYRRGYVSGIDFLLFPLTGMTTLLLMLGAFASWLASRGDRK